MRAAEDAVGRADQLGRERERRPPLADAARAVEEVRVRGRVVGERRAEQALRLGLLRKRSRSCPRMVSASCSGQRAVHGEERAGRAPRLAVSAVDLLDELVVLALDAIAGSPPRRARLVGVDEEQERAVGEEPAVAWRFSSSTRRCRARARCPGRRATSRGSGRRGRRLRARAPGDHLVDECARAAAKSAPRPRDTGGRGGADVPDCSPTSVPPGSRVVTTSRPSRSRCSPSSSTCVVLPEPSSPSKVTNIAPEHREERCRARAERRRPVDYPVEANRWRTRAHRPCGSGRARADGAARARSRRGGADAVGEVKTAARAHELPAPEDTAGVGARPSHPRAFADVGRRAERQRRLRRRGGERGARAKLTYVVAGVGNAPRSDFARTIVMYRDGYRREGQRLAHDMLIKLVGPLDGLRAKELMGAHIALVLGR